MRLTAKTLIILCGLLFASQAALAEQVCLPHRYVATVYADPACRVLELLPGKPYLALLGYSNTCFRVEVRGLLKATSYMGDVLVELHNPLAGTITPQSGPLLALEDDVQPQSPPAELTDFGLPETRRVAFRRGVVVLAGGTLEVAEAVLVGQGRSVAQQTIVGGTGIYRGASGYGDASGLAFEEPGLMNGELCLERR